mgnify:FL=1
MVTRFLSTSVRWLSRSLLALALIVAFAILVNFSTFTDGSVGLDLEQEIEINRALIEADSELSTGLYGQSIEAWDAGDYAAFFELQAQELEDPAQGMKPHAELYHAMAADAADAAYKRASELPAIEYLAYADKGLEWPATWNLSNAGLMSESDWIYARRWGGVIQAGFCLALALLTARMQRRGRLASQAPVSWGGDAVRVFLGSLASTAVIAVILALIWAPSVISHAVANGIGNPSFPVLAGSGSEYWVSSAGVAVVEGAVLWLLQILMWSLLAQMSIALFNNVAPSGFAGAIVLVIGWSALTPELRRSLGDVARFLPSTYLDVHGAVGSTTYFPSLLPIEGLSFANGCLAFGWAIALLAAAVVVWGLAGKKRPALSAPGGGAKGLVPSGRNQVAAKDPRPARASFAACVASFTKPLLARPRSYALAAAAALVLAGPHLLGLGPDLEPYSPERLKNARTQISIAEGSYEQGSAEREACARLRGLLSTYLNDTAGRAGIKALADYKHELGVLACDGSPLASELDVDAGRVEGEAAFLDAVSELPEPVLYGSTRRMPLLAYLGYVSVVVPAIAWVTPALALAAALVRMRTNGSLVQQAPVPARTQAAAYFISCGAVALAIGAAAFLPTALLCAASGAGLGGGDYPFLTFGAGGFLVRPAAPRAGFAAAVACASSALVILMGSFLPTILEVRHAAR